MKAVIFAGGKGTRLGALACDIPKPMVPVCGIPLIERQIKVLERYGIEEVVILTGHLGEVIEKHFSRPNHFALKISCFREDKPLGTTGALKEIENKLSGDFMVVYGDIMFDIDLAALSRFHRSKNAECSLVVHPNDHPFDSDLIEIEPGGKVAALHSKPHKDGAFYSNMASTGLYMLNVSALDIIRRGVKADFVHDALPLILKRGRVYGYVTAEYLKDVGTPQRLEQVEADCRSGRIERMNRSNRRKAVFLDRDGVINKDVGLIHKPEDLHIVDGAAAALKKINLSEYLAVVVTNQSVVARNLCSIKDLELIHKKMETLLGKGGAKLDAIYFCPHHPDKGYPEENPEYKIKCSCRKPATGMIEQAAREFNIELKGSYIVGDSDCDIECGKNAGLVTIGIRSKKVFKVKPDYLFDDLGQAADFILSR